MCIRDSGFTAYDWDGETNEYTFERYGEAAQEGDDSEDRDDTSSGYVNLVHPEDYDDYSAKFRDYIKGSVDKFDHTYRLKNRSLDEFRWTRDRSSPVRDVKTGRTIRLYGIQEDIHKEKLESDALVAAQERLLKAIESIPEPIALWGAEDRLINANSAYESLHGPYVESFSEGMEYSSLITQATRNGMYPMEGMDIDEFVDMKIVQNRRQAVESSRELSITDGRTFKVIDTLLPDGGLISFFMDISEVKRREKELGVLVDDLAVARDEANKASQAKSLFVANMSHELRTPLNAVIGLAALLKEDAEDDGLDDYKEPLDRIHTAGNHLLELINDVLDVSKIEAGKMDFHIEEFDIAKLVSDVASTTQHLAEANGNQLVIECSDDIGDMNSDITRVRQIVFNLVSNACKFTENGNVNISAKKEEVDSEEFLKIADDKFQNISKQADKELENKKKLIDGNLETMSKKLQSIEEHSIQLNQSLENTNTQTKDLKETTAKLREILSSSQKRGQWGERIVEDIPVSYTHLTLPTNREV